MRAAASAVFIFLLNAAVCWRLFKTEYLDQPGSIEGAFVALAGYIERHWPGGGEWFPMWFEGMPFAHVYQPALHYAAAGAAAALHRSPASAYHIVTALAYSLGGAAMFVFALQIAGDRVAALCAALLWSLFSPSLLFLGAVRADAGGLWNARRLQALAAYGEGPNVAGLMLTLFALALLHKAVVSRQARWSVGAALAVASVIATSWPGTVALAIAVFCYLMAMPPDFRRALPRTAAIGCLAYALACPFALPSTIAATFVNAKSMGEGVTPGAPRYAAWALLLAALAILCAGLRWTRAPLALRFALAYSLFLGWIAMAATVFDIRMVPQPVRFHLAMEIGLTLAIACAGRLICAKWPRSRVALGVALAVFCVFQFVAYRRYARQIIKPAQIRNTVEYRAAMWFDANLRGERVYAPGSVSFWMNAFTETPQLAGCCDQSLANPLNRTANYIIPAGYGSAGDDADYSLLWLKAYAVHAIFVGGPRGREHYKTFAHPYKFEGRLEKVWSDGDDYIYRVPERAPGLARVVEARALVQHPPVNGIDAAELRTFVAALDDPSLPLAETEWRAPDRALIKGGFAAGQAVSVAVNYHPGWTARVNGRPAAVRADGLGFLAIEPGCAGACAIDLRFSAGPERYFAWAIAALAAAGAALFVIRK